MMSTDNIPSNTSSNTSSNTPSNTPHSTPAVATATQAPDEGIIIRDIHQAYGDSAVLHGVNAHIRPGTVTSIIGPNGAGKSTLLSIIARLAKPTQGTVEVDGLNVHKVSSGEVAKVLAVLRQENTIGVRLTVRDLVGFGRFPHDRGHHRPEDLRIIEESLEYLELTDLADRFLDELSGGQRQRAFVAMVLAQDTRYVLLDEPLNNLDMKHAANMMNRVHRAARDTGRTFVLVIHDVNIAAAYSDRIIALRDGVVVADGTADEVLTTETLFDIYDMHMPVTNVEGQKMAMYFGRPDYQ